MNGSNLKMKLQKPHPLFLFGVCLQKTAMLLKVLSNALHFFCCCLVSFLVSLLPPTPFVLRPATGESGDPSGVATHTHEKLVCVLRDELLLDLVLVIAQDIDARENKALNLVIMEILYHLTNGQNPVNVANHMVQNNGSAAAAASAGGDAEAKDMGTDDADAEASSSSSSSSSSLTASSSASSSSSSSLVAAAKKKGGRRPIAGTKAGEMSLTQRLLVERSQHGVMSRSRHSHFGGVLWLDASKGKKKSISKEKLSLD